MFITVFSVVLPEVCIDLKSIFPLFPWRFVCLFGWLFLFCFSEIKQVHSVCCVLACLVRPASEIWSSRDVGLVTEILPQVDLLRDV